MKRQSLMNVMVVVLVSGLLTVVSCSKSKVATPDDGYRAQDPGQVQGGETDAQRAARLEAERIRAQQLRDQQLREQQLRDQQQGNIFDAKSRFLNQNILFDYDSAVLSGQARALLREKANWLQANPSDTVVIEGHCDERGTTVYNLALGERRANAARTYLVNLGIASRRLETVSYGEEKPLDPAHTSAAYRINRRAQFVIR